MLCSLTFQIMGVPHECSCTKIEFIAYSLTCRTAVPLERDAWGSENERRLTVGGLVHLKAVERGPIPFASGTY